MQFFNLGQNPQGLKSLHIKMLLVSEAGLTSLCFSEHPQPRGTSSKEMVLQRWDFRVKEISLPFSNCIRLTAYSALI